MLQSSILCNHKSQSACVFCVQTKCEIRADINIDHLQAFGQNLYEFLWRLLLFILGKSLIFWQRIICSYILFVKPAKSQRKSHFIYIAIAAIICWLEALRRIDDEFRFTSQNVRESKHNKRWNAFSKRPQLRLSLGRLGSIINHRIHSSHGASHLTCGQHTNLNTFVSISCVFPKEFVKIY